MVVSHTAEDEPAREGVIKFKLEFVCNRCIAEPMITDINAWRQICFRLGMIGQAVERYQGYGFGNISLRHQSPHANGYLITSTQTGVKAILGPDDYCHIISCDVAGNTIRAEGATEPSSEALTHGQIYSLDPDARCVIHVHSPEIWQVAEELDLLQTDTRAVYGTPAMADAVGSLFTESHLSQKRIFSMGGHEDGIVCYGATPEEAGLRLVSTLARALHYHDNLEIV